MRMLQGVSMGGWTLRGPGVVIKGCPDHQAQLENFPLENSTRYLRRNQRARQAVPSRDGREGVRLHFMKLVLPGH